MYQDRNNNNGWNRGGSGGSGNFDRGPRQLFPVEPAIQCAHTDEQGNQCPEMISELPFELRRDENGNPLKPVFCRNHVPARPPRQDNFRSNRY